MFEFDLHKDPPTATEIKSMLVELKTSRTEYIKKSCISDILHAFVFIALYFGQFLSGYAVMVAVALSTVVAIILATATRQKLDMSDRLAMAILAAATAVATVLILFSTMKQPLGGSLVGGLAAGSIVISGATLGRRIKQILVNIENMKPITEDDVARRELLRLCRNFPFLENYREQATINLRPNLTYGELAAMRQWARNHLAR